VKAPKTDIKPCTASKQCRTTLDHSKQDLSLELERRRVGLKSKSDHIGYLDQRKKNPPSNTHDEGRLLSPGNQSKEQEQPSTAHSRLRRRRRERRRAKKLERTQLPTPQPTNRLVIEALGHVDLAPSVRKIRTPSPDLSMDTSRGERPDALSSEIPKSPRKQLSQPPPALRQPERDLKSSLCGSTKKSRKRAKQATLPQQQGKSVMKNPANCSRKLTESSDMKGKTQKSEAEAVHLA
jgi:hypothetical protein